MASALSPGWACKLQNHLQPGSMDLGRYGVRLYLVDTHNGWTAAAAMTPTAGRRGRPIKGLTDESLDKVQK